MNTNQNDTRTYAQAATALGISPARFSALMQREGFKGPKGPRNARLVTRDDILRLLGRTVSDEAWEASRHVVAKTGKAEQQRRLTRRASLQAQLRPYDPGWVAMFIRDRDKQWGRAALAQGVELKAPPFPNEFRPVLGAQRVFTPEDVAELVAKAIASRDTAWRHWIADSHERAINPLGPPVVGSDQFFGDNLTGESYVHPR
jgi:hypothetical protein